MTDTAPIPVYQLRGYAIALDSDVAERFGAKTGPFNQTVKRNLDRFSEEFAFQLTPEEWSNLRSQIVIPSGHGGRRTLPWAFTEHGVVMVATLLRTEAAIAASRIIVQSFVASRRAAGLLDEPGRTLPRPVPETGGPLAGRIDGMIARILDTIANDEEGTTVREESRALNSRSLGAIRAHLDAKGIENDRTVAEIRKLMAEIETIDADVVSKTIEADHRRLALLAKQLQLVIGLQAYLDRGEVEAFLGLLRDLSGN
ncbi:ORF6N domain-containing protein [Roseicyclus persicicus]|uniref:ORF6N domain-containing protein n=1 Tax=Roseicyclus persicicus TaxID=2650661 RepID=A0A7X6H0C5_9RHOB|nr:ORF6N domain-containing protein [Roseibacterium persicicum]NKX45034.1 ORF6N domain-containing protein [Roseibacterium persicicum]